MKDGSAAGGHVSDFSEICATEITRLSIMRKLAPLSLAVAWRRSHSHTVGVLGS